MRARNLRVGRAEIDLLAVERTDGVIVEVKTAVARQPGDDPMHRVTDDKLDVLRQAGRRLSPPVWRIDVVTVLAHPDGARIRWLRDVD